MNTIFCLTISAIDFFLAYVNYDLYRRYGGELSIVTCMLCVLLGVLFLSLAFK